MDQDQSWLEVLSDETGIPVADLIRARDGNHPLPEVLNLKEDEDRPRQVFFL